MNVPELGVQEEVRERGGGDQREGLCGAADRLRGVPPEEEGEDAQEGEEGIQGGGAIF